MIFAMTAQARIFMACAAMADNPAQVSELPTPTEQAVEINEKLAEILERVELMKTADETADVVVSEPIKRTETPEK